MSLPLDYSLCILCQEFKKEKLLDLQSGVSIKNYEILESILTKFNNVTDLPCHIKQLINSGCMANNLFQNQAQWHKTCRVKYNNSSLEKLCRNLKGKENIVPASVQINQCEIPLNVDCNGSNVCIICEGSEHQEDFRAVTKASTYDTLIEAAKKLQNDELVGRLSMKTGEEKYHKNCFTDLYNKSKKLEIADLDNTFQNVTNGAYNSLWSYIASYMESNENYIFTLRNLKNIFKDYLNIKDDHEFREQFNSTRFKSCILKQFPLLREFKKGKEIFLATDVAVANVLSLAVTGGSKNDIFRNSANILRGSMFEEGYHNNGNLLDQETSVSTDLLGFMNYLLNGPKAELTQNALPSQAILSICQIIKYNALVFPSKKVAENKRHALGCETPLTRYVALSIYLATRKKNLVEKLHKLGLCLSYQRVTQILTNVANAICGVYLRDKAVYPINLSKGHFVTTSVDNIDHNSSSTTSVRSFHGTAISVNIHPDENGPLQFEELPIFSAAKERKMKQLPSEYTYVEPIPFINSANVNFPSSSTEPTSSNAQELNTNDDKFVSGMNSQREWLDEIENSIKTETLGQNISWSAFQGNKVGNNPVIVNKTGLLPLFNESSTSPAMIRHAMKVAMNTTSILNPGQTTVFNGDQPIFAIAKELQWLYPTEFGEDKLVVMFGGLHIEKTFLICIGNWLKGSEWDIALSNADIFTSGTAESCLHSSHITRTRTSHQITAAVLFILKRRVFKKEGIDESMYDQWEKSKSLANPQFYYWNAVLQLELLYLTFVKSLRERDFELYISTLEKMVPWFFALDHIHYARWISVHIRDMRNLQKMHPEIYKSFKNGKFVFQKTNRCFSAMALDQCHEQHNSNLKGDGGVIGITQNETTLTRWMVSGPEIARIVAEFGEKYGLPGNDQSNTFHHDMTPASQKRFFQQVTKLLAEFEHNANPFEDDSELISLVNKYKFDDEAIDSIRKAEEIATKKYNEFIEKRFVEKSIKFSEKITLNKLQLLSKRHQRNVSSSQKKLELVTSDCGLFSRLFISAQSRSTDLDNFFTFENHPFPPSISDNGNLRSGKNSDIVQCLREYYKGSNYQEQCTGIIFHGGDLEQLVKPTGFSKTFNDYYHNDVEQYLKIIFQRYERLDIVFDVLRRNSLTNALRKEKGSGRIQRVSGDQNLPKNWNSFLQSMENSVNLHTFLADKIRNITDGFCIATKEDGCISNFSYDFSNIAPCNHEGSATRIFVHVRDMMLSGHSKIIIRTLDYNVIAIAVSNFAKLDEISELWIWYGTKNQLEYIPIHKVCSELGIKLSSSFAFFHTFTGCESVSFFYCHGKISAFKLFKLNDNLVNLVSQYGLGEFNDLPKEIEKFVASWYDSSKHCDTVNLTRKYLFVTLHRAMERLPPTKAALFQHFKRAIYQALGIWGNALIKMVDAPSPSDWGWIYDDENSFVPLWTTNPQLSEVCAELQQCKCKGVCSISLGCKCKKYVLQCTPSCSCEGKCNKKDL